MKRLLYIMMLVCQAVVADPNNELFSGEVCNPMVRPELVKIYDNFNKTAISANFVQKSFVKALKKDLLCKGRIFFAPNEGIIWETDSPYTQCLYITKSGEVYEKDKSDPIGSFRYASLMSEMIHSGADKLSDAFEIYFREDGANWLLGLKPKKRIIGKFIRNIVITGDKSGRLNEVIIMGEEDKISEISIQNHQFPPAEEVKRVHEIFSQK